MIWLVNLLVGLYWLAVTAFYGVLLHLIYTLSPLHAKLLVVLFLLQKTTKYSFTNLMKNFVVKNQQLIKKVMEEALKQRMNSESQEPPKS